MRVQFTLIALMVINSICFSQLIDWDLNGEPGDQVSSNSNTSATGIGTGVLTRGSGLIAVTGANSMNSREWVEATNEIDDISNQISENDYYEFDLPIQTNYNADVTNVIVLIASSGTGPDGAVLRWDQDSYSSDIASLGSGSGTLTASIDQTLTGSIIFRLYGTRSTTGGSTVGTMRVNDITINGTTNLLPIELIELKVETIGSISQIQWSTLSETNNSHFEIEHKTSLSGFKKIGAVAGNGTTLDRNDYSFTHSPTLGTNYYRLKQVDFDGSYSYSDVVSIENLDRSKVSVYPTVVSDKLTLANLENDGLQKIVIIDISGKKVKDSILEAGWASYDFNVSDLPSGHYFLNLISDLETTTLRFIKQ